MVKYCVYLLVDDTCENDDSQTFKDGLKCPGNRCPLYDPHEDLLEFEGDETERPGELYEEV